MAKTHNATGRSSSKADRQVAIQAAVTAAEMALVVATPAPAEVAPTAPANALAVIPVRGTSTSKRWRAGALNKDNVLLPKTAGASIAANDVITLLVSENPKRKGSKGRFAKYRNGMTVSEYCEAIGTKGLAMADIAWDINHGFIRVNAAVEAPAPAEETPAEVGEYEASEEQAA